jgi:Ala-tRNA(Pro) deacylase
MVSMPSSDPYDSLIRLLDGGRARYRLLDHPPEGRTELVSRMRGNRLSQAAKCMVVMVKQGKKITRYVLAVVPGDMQVDLEAIKRLLEGTYVSFASPAVAEQIAGAQIGTILPFPLSGDLELIVDPTLLEEDEIYFNAGRLDRSVALAAADYLALTQPRRERIGRTPI